MTEHDRRNDKLSHEAFLAGQAFAEEHAFSEFQDDRDSGRLMDNGPPHLWHFADVFKYGCQDVWRRNGELP